MDTSKALLGRTEAVRVESLVVNFALALFALVFSDCGPRIAVFDRLWIDNVGEFCLIRWFQPNDWVLGGRV